MVTKVSLAQILKISPQKINKFLVVALGNKVLKGETLAIKKGFFGKKIEVKTPVSGTVGNITSLGELTIETPDSEDKPSEEQKELVKEEEGRSVFWGRGQGKGEVVWHDGILEFTQLSGELANKIIACESISSATSAHKAAALGATGILVVYQHEKLNNLPENIGFLAMAEKNDKKTSEFLKKLAGKKVLIDGNRKKLVILKNKTKHL